MSETDVIREIARQVLTVPTLAGTEDNWLWDRAQRLVRNVEHICRLPELAEAKLAIDRFCLTAGAYFSDAGFARYADPEDTAARFVLADVTLGDLLDFSTQIVSDRLSGALAGPKIDKINRIIIESGNRFTDMTEAKVLSDARNLDDMGAVGLFNEFRRYVIHGRGASEVLDSWQRKIDYRYWEARLKEGFRIESVRKLASKRFSAAKYFMMQLGTEHSAKDLEDAILESLNSKPDS
ncbi:MAG TPA: hypothetical protein HPP87_00650 [Planctomycetes bacterium]|nr:hypothetical protein [Planctomycetota bacterium]HIJ69853.1 hypothetical protein [Planctomycetota bacterium]